VIKKYYLLTKPGIIRGNLVTAVAGFLFASNGDVHFLDLIILLLGIALVIAAACVANNYIDRDIDRKMERTKKRPLVTGDISTKSAIIYACLLGLMGFILLLQLGYLTVLIGIVGVIDYVVVYGYAKRRSVHGTLIGGISGATALVAGYVAVTNSLDLTAAFLFLIMLVWQMPHFYAIAIYRRQDYLAAGLPVMSVVKGVRYTQVLTIIYIALYTVSAATLPAFGYTGVTYFIVMTVLSLAWLWMAILGLANKDNAKWGHQIFGFSLIVLIVFSVLLSVNNFLP
jgi:protoheme IX farnesyltransferase